MSKWDWIGGDFDDDAGARLGREAAARIADMQREYQAGLNRPRPSQTVQEPAAPPERHQTRREQVAALLAQIRAGDRLAIATLRDLLSERGKEPNP